MKFNPIQKLKKLIDYLKEVGAEMKKITWMGLKEALRYSLIVLLASVVMAAFLGAADYGFAQALSKLIAR